MSDMPYSNRESLGDGPLVSVCCAWFNRPEAIHDTIAGLVAQDFQRYEIIIVNDGSPDDRVREILDTYDQPGLTIVHQHNTGAPGALNHAIRLAKASYIAVHDAGDVSLPNRLREQYDALQRNPDLVGVGCFTEDVNGDSERRIVYATNNDKPAVVTRSDFLGPRNYLSGGEVMFRKTIYETVGGYRDVFRYAQDRDLWLRMSEHGDFSIVQKLLYQRRIFSAGVKGSLKKSVMQKHLSHFARECAQMRDKKGYDLVDVFGPQSNLFRRRTKTLSNILARTSLWYFYNGDSRSAELLAELSFKERRSWRSALARALALVYTNSEFGARLIRRLLHGRMAAQNMQDPDPLIL